MTTIDPEVTFVEKAVRAHLSRDFAAAHRALKSIPRAAQYADICPPSPSRSAVANGTPGEVTTDAVTTITQAKVFRRDQYTCRYCKKKTIFLGVLRLLSQNYPNAFPWHKNWKWDNAHSIYWSHSTSIDHYVPRSRGGDNSWSNLRTACYICNATKGNLSIQELGWTDHGPSPEPWDGLTGLYGKLYQASPHPKNDWHKPWIGLVTPPSWESI
jgi:5-methylcytosine-specific restriction endonuclease McrA